MHKNKGRTNKNIYKSFLICFGLSVGIIVAVALLFALLSSILDDPTGNLGLFSLFALLISAAVSGFISSRIKGEGGVRFASLVALATVLIMLLINVITCGGKVNFGAFMNYICYFGVASLTALLGKKRSNHRKHRR